MKAMILAAGGGTRLHPLTHHLPKPMAPIANIAVMEHIVELLARHGCVVDDQTRMEPAVWEAGQRVSSTSASRSA